MTALPAHAITLYSFRGKVLDAIGRPLVGATVADQANRTATAGADGSYVLPEESTGKFTLRAWRSDTLTVTKVVNVTLPLDQTVDFSLMYTMSGTLANWALSTVSGSASTTLTITTSTPNPGLPGETGGKSCVYVTDSRTGQTTSATYVPIGNAWTWGLTVPQGSTEGPSTLTYVAKDCAVGTVLSASANSTYVIDNTAPKIDPLTITPLDHGNTMFLTSQPLLAKITDTGGSGVKLSTIMFTVVDDRGTPADATDDTTSSIAAASYSSGTGWAKTSGLSLSSGHTYRVSVSAADFAGNSTSATHSGSSVGGGFLATLAPTLRAAKALIPSTSCTVTAQPDTFGQKTVTCAHVPLQIEPSLITLAATRHAGIGYVEQRVVLNSAKLRVKTNGVEGLPIDAYNANDPAWGPRVVSSQFVVLSPSSSPQDVVVSPVSATVGTLTLKIPALWTEASLEMTATDTSPNSTASTSACSDPSTSSVACVPDPIRFFTGDQEGAKILEAHEKTLNVNAEVPSFVKTLWLSYFYWYTAIDGSQICLGEGEPARRCLNSIKQHWQPLAPQGGCLDYTCAPCPYDGSADCFLELLNGYPTIEPRYYGTACRSGVADCNSLENPDSPTHPVVLRTSTGDQIESQKARTTVGSSVFDWGPGVFPGKESDSGGPRDWWHLAGSAYIVWQTNDANYDNLHTTTKCNHRHRNYHGPFLCYGFADGRNYDGVGAGWPGSWFVASADPPRYYYVAKADFFGDGADCFANSPVRWGSANEFSWIVWDTRNIKVEGAYPEDWSGAGGLVTLQGSNQSGGMKALQEGSFYSPTVLGNLCEWSTWAYAVGGDIWQRNNNQPDPGEVQVEFNHTWTPRTWNWSVGCSTSKSCAVSASPSNDTESWVVRGKSEPYTY